MASGSKFFIYFLPDAACIRCHQISCCILTKRGICCAERTGDFSVLHHCHAITTGTFFSRRKCRTRATAHHFAAEVSRRCVPVWTLLLRLPRTRTQVRAPARRSRDSKEQFTPVGPQWKSLSVVARKLTIGIRFLFRVQPELLFGGVPSAVRDARNRLVRYLFLSSG
jgi:hypothetical protein